MGKYAETKRSQLDCTPEQEDIIRRRECLVYKTWSLMPPCKIKDDCKEDLISAGFEGLCYGAKHWDPELSALDTFLIECIKTNMMRKFVKLIKKQNHTIHCIDIDMVVQNPDGGVISRLIDIIPDPDENVEENFIRRFEGEQLIEVAKKVCTKKELYVLNLYTYKYMSLVEIANKMGITRQGASYFFNNAKNKILQYYEENGLNA